MKPFAFLFHWYNLPFTMALATGIVLALLQLFGGFGDNDAEVEAAPAADLAVDGDLEADAPAGSGGSLAAHGGPLAALGVGRVPLVLIIMALLSSLGALGLFANSLLSALAAPYPGLAFVPVFLLAAIGALPLTRVISGGLARMAPRTSTAVNNEDLIGRAGVVVSAGVSQTYGRARPPRHVAHRFCRDRARRTAARRQRSCVTQLRRRSTPLYRTCITLTRYTARKPEGNPLCRSSRSS
jgi:hypothetical protein